MTLLRGPFDSAVQELRVRCRAALLALEELLASGADSAAVEPLIGERQAQLAALTAAIEAAGELPRTVDEDEISLHRLVDAARALLGDPRDVACRRLAEAEAGLEQALAALAATPPDQHDRIDRAALPPIATAIAATSRAALELFPTAC